jgi:hypothetical protein
MGDYGFTFKNKVFTPNQTEDVELSENDARNAAIEKAELDEWTKQPDHFACYVDKSDTVTTWRNMPLGRIIARRSCRHNFGSHQTYIKIRGNNGATYSGRFESDWSQLCRIHKIKNA